MEGDVNPAPLAGPRGDFEAEVVTAPPPMPAKDEDKDVLVALNSDPVNLTQSQWVEIPDCKGLAKEIALSENNENAVFATCKQRPGVAPVPEAYKYPTK